MNKPSETLIRICIDKATNPIEWEVWVRSNNKSPWAFILGGTAQNLDQARKSAYKAVDSWVQRIEDSTIKLDILDERNTND